MSAVVHQRLAGVLVAYGSFVLLAALVGAVAVALGLDTKLASNDWATLGTGGAVTVTVVAFVAYLFGGYVAGRMARRAGLVNGLAVFALAVLLVLVVGAIAASQTDTETIQANLRTLGLPITGTDWAHLSTVAGIGTLVGMLLGAGIGGVVGSVGTASWPGGRRWAGAARTTIRTSRSEPGRPRSANPKATLRITGRPEIPDC